MESLLVSDDLYRDTFSGSVISALEYLTEGTLAKESEDFIPIGQVIAEIDQIISTFIVVTVVVLACIGVRRPFRVLGSGKPDGRIVENLASFIQR